MPYSRLGPIFALVSFFALTSTVVAQDRCWCRAGSQGGTLCYYDTEKQCRDSHRNFCEQNPRCIAAPGIANTLTRKSKAKKRRQR